MKSKKTIQKPISEKNIDTYSQTLAERVKENHILNWDAAHFNLMEHFEILRSDGETSFTATWEPFLDLHTFTTEIACLLTNPEISAKLSDYIQKNAGNMLRKLIWFFERMQDDSISYLLLWYRLRYNLSIDKPAKDDLDLIAAEENKNQSIQ